MIHEFRHSKPLWESPAKNKENKTY